MEVPYLKANHPPWEYLNSDCHPGDGLLGEDHGVALLAGQSQAVCSVSGQVLQGDDPHAHQVAAVDPLIALRQDGLHTLGGRDNTTHGFTKAQFKAKNLLSESSVPCPVEAIEHSSSSETFEDPKPWVCGRRTSRKGPLAAQSLELPEPYSFPARMSRGVPVSLYFSAASNTSSWHRKQAASSQSNVGPLGGSVSWALGRLGDKVSYHLSRGDVQGAWCLLVDELVEETDVGERAPGHHGIVATARAVGVEVSWVQSGQRETH